ncbi:MAG: right-handed parallel beta-helix repeat-containing protein [Candidatus Micrarchaeia archaeon]
MVDAPNDQYDSNEGVMKVEVTPKSPLMAQQPYSTPSNVGNSNDRKSNFVKIIIPIVLVAIVAIALIGLKSSHFIKPQTTTTISSVNASAIKECTSINNPGNYYLVNNINTTISKGACININANNVAFVCNGKIIRGAGPYVNVSPFTYGILVQGKKNVSIQGCNVYDFSYGAYINDSDFVKVENSNMSRNYMENIYINDTRNSRFLGNRLDFSAGLRGSIYVASNSKNNTFENNTMLYNRYYGIYIGSSGNEYYDNYLNDTPVSFYCYGANGFTNSNKGASNLCYNNTGCGFLTCKGINTPTNLSQIYLTNNITSCGSIMKPGVYNLSSNVYMNEYVNTSSPLFLMYNIPCINIASNNVTLNCKSHQVGYAPYAAITLKNVRNITIENCNINSSYFGIAPINTTKVHIYNITATNNQAGIALQNSSYDVISNLNAYGNNYGVYISGSTGNLFDSFNTSNNIIGIYVTGSLGNTFNNGVALKNSKIDVYASSNAQNATYNLMQKTICMYTNAAWATCKSHIIPNLTYTPVISCMNISKPGNYSILNNIYGASNKCLDVNTNNTKINCNGHTITSKYVNSGIGLYVNNSANVSFTDCNFRNFNTSIELRNSKGISVINTGVNVSYYGIYLDKVLNSFVFVGSIQSSANSGIYLNNSKYNIIESVNITRSGTALQINNSTNNYIKYNNGTFNNVGMLLTGISNNNTIENNNMTQSISFDYLCIGNSGVNAENGGVNFGTKKSNCMWLEALSTLTPDITCTTANKPSSISLMTDYLYPYGYKCYNVYANGTTINCNGHTILATSGGTFATFRNASGAKIENCVLKGFTDPITAINSSVDVINDTIISNLNYSTGVDIMNSYYPEVINNNITAHVGIEVSNSTNGKIYNNTAEYGMVGYLLENSTGFKITGNSAMQNVAVGFILNGSIFNIFKNNNFYSVAGIECYGKAIGSANNTNEGGNTYITNQDCKWLQ